MASMLPMPSQIAVYQEMSALSSQMVEAAQANDWDSLAVLEKSVSALRDALMSQYDDGDIPAEEARLKAALIQRILDDDAEVRRHTEPWMEQVRRYLGSSSQRQRVNDAYGAAATPFGRATR